jgi:hypothetical protein
MAGYKYPAAFISGRKLSSCEISRMKYGVAAAMKIGHQ